jgi:hypothetical protein
MYITIKPILAIMAAAITTVAALSLAMMPVATMNQAYGAGSAGSLDPNGVRRIDALGAAGPFSDDIDMSYDSEYYIGSAVKNFRSDGSMRIDWESKPASMSDTDGVFLAGYFNINLGGEVTSGNDCTANPSEEISMKMNGGPHSDSNSEWADTMDSGTISFNGDRSRFRTEEDHPDYSGSYSGRSLPGGWPIQTSNLCTVPGGWVGAATVKVNVDTNSDGTADAVRIIHYVDESGLDSAGKPRNNWEVVYYQQFAVPNGMDVKSMLIPYVCTIGQCDEHQETIRIDEQSLSRWQSTSNPPYRFVTYKEIIVQGTGGGTPDPDPDPETFTTLDFANLNQGQRLTNDYEAVVTASPTNTVSNIKLYVDSTLVGTQNSAPYEFRLDIGDFSDGTHTLRAVATATSSAGGGTVTETISVVFDN